MRRHKDAARRAARFCVEELERRTLLAGELDPTFGAGGIVLTDFGRSTPAVGAALQADGKIVVAGGGFELARYNKVDGSPDMTFDADGVVVPTGLPPAARAEAVAVYADATNPHFGKIVVVGTSQDATVPSGPIPQITVVRFNPDGSLDAGFGAGGVVGFHTHQTSVGFATGKAVAIDKDGRIIVGATSYNGSTQFETILRFLPDGTPDPSFGIIDGQLSFYFGGNPVLPLLQSVTGLLLQPDGKIVVSGQGFVSNVGVFLLARFDPAGGLLGRGDFDQTFGDGGTVVTDFAMPGGSISPFPIPHDAGAWTIDRAPDGDVLIGGRVRGVHGPRARLEFALARFEVNHPTVRDGTLSAAFGDSVFPGRAARQFQNLDSFGTAVAVQPNSGNGSEKILMGGSVLRGPDSDHIRGDFALLRLNWDGSPDGTFGTNGWVVTDLAAPGQFTDDAIRSVLITSEETAVAVGQSGRNKFALARYLIGDPDRDHDGVLNVIEDGHPNKVTGTTFGDGNGPGGTGDGIRDADQERVASLPNAQDGTYVTVFAAQGDRLEDVRAVPSLEAPPLRGAVRPVGTFSLKVPVNATGAADLEIYLPPGATADSLFQFGATADDRLPHWTQVPLSPPSYGGDLRVRLFDGGLGDGDARADGTVTLVCAPAALDTTPLSIKGNVYNDLDGDGIPIAGFPPEPALPGWKVFLDLDHDETPDANEPWSLSDASGNYAFLDDDALAPGVFEQDESNGGLVARVNLARQTYPFVVDVPPNWINTGPGAFRRLHVGGRGRALVHRVVPGDFDADGDQDLIALGRQLDGGTRSAFAYRNRGDGSFLLDTSLSDLLDEPDADDVIIADFTNDGVPDIVETGSSPTFSFIDVYFDDVRYGGMAAHSAGGMGDDFSLMAAAIDLNHDGYLDVVVGTKHYVDESGNQVPRGRLGILLNQYTQWVQPNSPVPLFSAPMMIDLPGQVTHVVASDLVPGGDLEVVTSNLTPSGQEIRVWEPDGAGGLARLPSLPPGLPADLFPKSLTLAPPLSTVFAGPARLQASGLIDSDLFTDYVIDTPDHDDLAIVPARSRTLPARLADDPQSTLGFGSRSLFTGSITVSVLDDVNGNGGPDPGEPSPGGIRVILDQNENGTFDAGIDRLGTTNGDGVYTFGALPPGDYRLFVQLPAGYQATAPPGGAGTVHVTTGQSFLDFTIRSVPGTIQGVVWDDRDGNGVQDAGEPGLPGVAVYIDLAGDGIGGDDLRVSSGPDGRYEFPAAPTGRAYDLLQATPSGFAQTSPDPFVSLAHRLNLGPGATARANFGNGRLGSVAGVKWTDWDGDGTPDPGEPRAGNVVLFIDLDRDGSRDPGEPFGVTGPDGSYSIANVPPGVVLLSVDAVSTFEHPVSQERAFGFSVAVMGSRIVVGDPGLSETEETSSDPRKFTGAFTVFDGTTGAMLYGLHSDLGERFAPAIVDLTGVVGLLNGMGLYGDDYILDVLARAIEVPDTFGFGVVLTPDAIIGSSLGFGNGYVVAWDPATRETLTPMQHQDVPYESHGQGYLLAATEEDGVAGADGFVAANGHGAVSVYHLVSRGHYDAVAEWNAGMSLESIAGVGVGKLAAGSPETEVNGLPLSGMARLYDVQTGAVLRTFRAPVPAEGDNFGSAVAGLGGADVIVGAPGTDSGAADAGVAYVYSGQTGLLRYTLSNPDPGAADYFGFSVASVGDFVLVGAPYDDTFGPNAGAVYLFDGPTGRFLRAFYSPSPHAGALFGFSLAAMGDRRFVAGAPSIGTAEHGAVYLFEVGPRVVLTPGEARQAVNLPEFFDTDRDGASDALENLAGGNGNGTDDFRDADQPNVASLRDAVTNGGVSIIGPDGVRLVDVAAVDPSQVVGGGPAGSTFPAGLFRFTLDDVQPGGTFDVRLVFSSQVAATTYLKASVPSSWYEFIWDCTAGHPGAQLIDTDDDGLINEIVLHLHDGDLGDADGQADGRIVDPGGPAVVLPATVDQAFVGSAAWGEGFRTALDVGGLGDASFGYRIRGGGEGELLPWIGLNRITLRFDRDVPMTATDLLVRGITVPEYPIGDFFYDPVTHIAVWSLAQGIVNDHVRVSLAGSPARRAADFQFDVLAGDATRNRAVNALDVADVKRRLNRSATAPGAGPAAYSPFADVSGDGRINALDLSAVKQRLNRSLPSATALFASPLPTAADNGESEWRSIRDLLPA